MTARRDPSHPDYHEGFFAAQCGEPLRYGESVQFRWGWLGFWRVRRLLARMEARAT